MISIITISLNSEKTIERTMRSVLGQSFRDIEYIIVDGNSTDNTHNIIFFRCGILISQKNKMLIQK